MGNARDRADFIAGSPGTQGICEADASGRELVTRGMTQRKQGQALRHDLLLHYRMGQAQGEEGCQHGYGLGHCPSWGMVVGEILLLQSKKSQGHNNEGDEGSGEILQDHRHLSKKNA